MTVMISIAGFFIALFLFAFLYDRRALKKESKSTWTLTLRLKLPDLMHRPMSTRHVNI
ncbi:MAG: hypothetical protein H0Z33_16415 [Bacillaceae bacterium]|nr:hypothetical protein [Bacillaceae bacterium]